MNIKTVVAAVAVLSASLAAHADVTYTFTGVGAVAGTSFTIVSSGFLSYSSDYVSAATGEDIDNGIDLGAITGVQFINDGLIGVETAGFFNGVYFGDSSGTDYDISADGTYTDEYGSTLTISGSPSVTPTPEPSSILLLGTGLLGIAGVMRRRFA